MSDPKKRSLPSEQETNRRRRQVRKFNQNRAHQVRAINASNRSKFARWRKHLSYAPRQARFLIEAARTVSGLEIEEIYHEGEAHGRAVWFVIKASKQGRSYLLDYISVERKPDYNAAKQSYADSIGVKWVRMERGSTFNYKAQIYILTMM